VFVLSSVTAEGHSVLSVGISSMSRDINILAFYSQYVFHTSLLVARIKANLSTFQFRGFCNVLRKHNSSSSSNFRALTFLLRHFIRYDGEAGSLRRVHQATLFVGNSESL
jgi:hypothetical protein